MVWYSHLFQNFLQFIVIHTVKGFDIVSKAEVDVFLELIFKMKVLILCFSKVLLTHEVKKETCSKNLKLFKLLTPKIPSASHNNQSGLA